MVIVPGVSIGNSLGPYGSVGLILRSGDTGTLYALSCSHVLARCGTISSGALVVSNGGPLEEGSLVPVGILSEFYTSMEISALNDADFAVCSLDPGVAIDPCNANIGQITWVSHLTAQQFSSLNGIEVLRAGAETGLERGVVQGWPGTYLTLLNMPVMGGAISNINIVMYETSCAEGDSGSAVIDATTGEVLGLHVGGDSAQGVGYFCPLGQTLEKWGLELAI